MSYPVRYFILVSLIILPSIAAEEQAGEEELPPMVVTATRTATPVREVGSSITLITQKEIERRGSIEVADILRDVPGLTIIGSRASGIGSFVFLRGAETRHTIVFIDGVPMNSPTLGSFDFSYLESLNIQSIEVLRGPQSPLYGSTAIGGVISITTQKGEGPFSGEIIAEYGSFGTHREIVRASGGNDAGDFSLVIANTMSEGINIAEGSKNKNLSGLTYLDGTTPARYIDEEDEFETQTGVMRLGLNFMDDGRADFFLRWIEASQDLDSPPTNASFDLFNFTVDDPTYKKDVSTQAFSTTVSKTIMERWKPSLRLALQLDDQRFRSDLDPFANGRVQTQVFNAEIQNDLTLTDYDILTFGAEYESEEGSNEGNFSARSTSAYGIYIQNQIELFNALHVTAGLRYDYHSRAGDKTTYRFTAAYLIDRFGTKLHGSVGTGFRAPTINQLFWPSTTFFGGNPNLKPEKSFGLDIGIEQRLFDDRFSADITYFRNTFDDLIDWITVGIKTQPENVAKARSEGVEVTIKAKPLDNIELRSSYTYLETRDKENDKRLNRRPRHSASIGATFLPIERLAINLNVVIVQDRIDDVGGQIEDMDNFVRADISITYRILDALRAHLRIENLADQDYEEVTGYQSPGIGVYGGLSWQF